MDDQQMKADQLREECERLRRRVAELEKSEARHILTEDLLKKNEARFHRIAENSRDIIYRIRLPGGDLEYVSPSSLLLTGYSAEELRSEPLLIDKILYPGFSRFFRGRKKKLMADEAPTRHEHKITRKSGEEGWFYQTNVLVRDEKGQPVALEGVITDITERKLAEETLRASEQRFRSLVETTSDWVWEIGRDGFYTYSSPKVKDLLGYGPEEVLGRRPVDFMPRAEAERVAALFRDIVESRKPFTSLENVNLRKHGRLVVLETSGVPIFDARGDFAGYRGIDRDITQRKRAEQALRESEGKFRSLVERSNVGVFLIQDWVITYANARFAEMVGYSVGEMINRTRPEDIVHPEDYWNFARENIRRRLAGEIESIRYEVRLVTKTGEIRNAEAYGSRTVYRGRPAVIGTVLDITERKAAEKALREAEERLRNIFENATVGIFRSNRNGKYLHVNPAFARIFGYESPEEMANSIEDMGSQLWVHPEEREEAVRVATESGSHNFEVQARTRRGDMKWLSVSARVVTDERGDTAFDGFVQDITEAKRAEAALKESEEKYRSMFENSPLGIFQSTFDGKFVQVNPALARILGYRSPLEVTDSVHDIARQIYADPKRRPWIIKEMLETNDQMVFENEYFRKDGSTWIGHLTLRVIRDESGAPHHLDGIVEDVTEKKKMEEKLKGTMKHLRSLSHRLLEVQEAERRHLARELHDEVGQTLTALRIGLKRLERTRTGEKLTSGLTESVGLVDGLIKQVRNLSIELRPSILDDFGLVAALDWYINRLAPLMGFKAVLHTEFTEERLPPLLELTCFRIAQEALTNIVRHSGARNVYVELKIHDGQLHLSVKDDGKGFDVEKTRKGALKGRTFGLLGMRERASLAGGRLEFKSEPGKGTEIHGHFPLEAAPGKKK